MPNAEIPTTTDFRIERYHKLVFAVIGFVLLVLSTYLAIAPEVLPVAWLPHIQVAISVGTAVGVYKVPNEQ